MVTLHDDITPSLIQTGRQIIIMIGADHCGYCAAIKPFFETMSELYSDIEFYFLYTHLADGINKYISFEGIPAIASFRDGRLLSLKEGGDVDFVLEVLESFNK